MTDKKNYNKKKLKFLKRKIRYSFLYALSLSARKSFVFLPESWVYFLCERIAVSVFHLSQREKNKTINHLTLAYKNELTKKQINKIAKNTFINLGRNLAELILWDTFTHEKIKERIKVSGLEHIADALKHGNGGIILANHCGNFELVPAAITANGYTGTVITRSFHDKNLNNLLKKLRESKGYRTIDREASPKTLFKVLKDNMLIGILADQDIRKINGVFVNFFGMPAYTPTAPVQIALSAKCPILPTFIVRNETNKYYHHLIINPPVELIDDRKNSNAIIENTQRWTNVLENHIRKYPAQWVWMHKRWKTTPEKLKRENNEKNDSRNSGGVR